MTTTTVTTTTATSSDDDAEGDDDHDAKGDDDVNNNNDDDDNDDDDFILIVIIIILIVIIIIIIIIIIRSRFSSGPITFIQTDARASRGQGSLAQLPEVSTDLSFEVGEFRRLLDCPAESKSSTHKKLWRIPRPPRPAERRAWRRAHDCQPGARAAKAVLLRSPRHRNPEAAADNARSSTSSMEA